MAASCCVVNTVEWASGPIGISLTKSRFFHSCTVLWFKLYFIANLAILYYFFEFLDECPSLWWRCPVIVVFNAKLTIFFIIPLNGSLQVRLLKMQEPRWQHAFARSLSKADHPMIDFFIDELPPKIPGYVIHVLLTPNKQEKLPCACSNKPSVIQLLRKKTLVAKSIQMVHIFFNATGMSNPHLSKMTAQYW